MNSRSEHRVPFNVRTSVTIHCHAFQLLAIACCVFIVSSPPLSPDSRYDCCRCFPPPLIDYFVDDRVPLLSSFQASRAIPLSHISPTFLYLSVALGICCCYVAFLFKCIACLCRPLMYLSFILLQPI